MNTEDQHTMVVKKTYSTGVQEWYCPTCGRHIILQWPPNYKRIVLDEGNTAVFHTGGTCETSFGLENIQPGEAENDGEESPEESLDNMIGLEDPYLLPWLRWIGDRDF